MWFRVDSSIGDHPKAITAGDAALGYWLRMGAWAAHHLTDGRVPENVARSKGTRAQIERLVKAGLWVPDGDGWRFHDWHDYNPSGTDVELARERQTEAGRLANHKRWHQARGVTNPDCLYCITIR